mmetsp:Transcript_1929/g.4371  ORF Transcript_1929/g.4371 Transcript_1929/m.4371 type:complete len:205 (+) Transcript_1929:1083-1697(+)
MRPEDACDPPVLEISASAESLEGLPDLEVDHLTEIDHVLPSGRVIGSAKMDLAEAVVGEEALSLVPGEIVPNDTRRRQSGSQELQPESDALCHCVFAIEEVLRLQRVLGHPRQLTHRPDRPAVLFVETLQAPLEGHLLIHPRHDDFQRLIVIGGLAIQFQLLRRKKYACSLRHLVPLHLSHRERHQQSCWQIHERYPIVDIDLL